VRILPPSYLDPTRGEVTLDPSASSQQVSALMLVGPRLPRGLRIRVQGPLPSRPYVDLTAQLLGSFGALVEMTTAPGGLTVITVARGGLAPREYEVEGDHSSASYPLAAGFLTGIPVRVTNTSPGSLQGDRVFGALLEKLSAPAPAPAEGPRVFDLADTPDIAPTLATCALFAEGPSLLTGCELLRLKESDRLAVLARGFEAVGADLDELPGGLLIRPRPLAGHATLDPARDHRMAMCFALLGLRLPSIEVSDKSCVSKSYPGFFQMLERFSALVEPSPSTPEGR
jgi:3-phosphoshikimate 1-carboxyvinyltransferase